MSYFHWLIMISMKVCLTSLSQVNYIRNSLGHLLDQCFVTNPDCVFLSKVAPLTQPEDPYHPAFKVPIDTGAVLEEKSEKTTKRFHCFRKADFWRLNPYISGFDWSDLYSSQNIDDAINIFYSAVNSICNPSVSNKPPWFSKELTHLRNNKSEIYRKFKDTFSQSNYSRYLSDRSSFTVLKSLCYKNYLNRCKVNNFFNVKLTSTNSSLSFENITATTDQSISDLFVTFFQRTYSEVFLFDSNLGPHLTSG